MLKNQKGLTLIEVLITIGLIGFVIVLVNQMYHTQFRSVKVTEEKSKLATEAREIQTTITQLAMESVGILKVTVDGVDETNNQQLNQGKVIEVVLAFLDKPDVSIKYDREEQTLTLNQRVLSERMIDFDVSPLGASYEEADSIQLSFGLQSTVLRQVVNEELDCMIMFRNKELSLSETI